MCSGPVILELLVMCKCPVRIHESCTVGSVTPPDEPREKAVAAGGGRLTNTPACPAPGGSPLDYSAPDSHPAAQGCRARRSAAACSGRPRRARCSTRPALVAVVRPAEQPPVPPAREAQLGEAGHGSRKGPADGTGTAPSVCRIEGQGCGGIAGSSDVLCRR